MQPAKPPPATDTKHTAHAAQVELVRASLRRGVAYKGQTRPAPRA
jgi:hypothetical protein